MTNCRIVSKARFRTDPIDPSDMRLIGGAFLSSQDARLTRAFDVRDAPALPLTMRYASWKAKKGGRPIRNWNLTGYMRKMIEIVSASANRVAVGIQDPRAALLLACNIKLNLRKGGLSQWGVSPSDQSAILGKLQEVRKPGVVEKVK